MSYESNSYLKDVGKQIVFSLVKSLNKNILGLIDFLLSKHRIAKELREKLIFKVNV